jgi:hypothetical protein
MSKKQKRQARINPVSEKDAVVGVRSVAAATASPMRGTQEFKPDYSYVIKDLKKIGIMVAVFVVILVVVAFVI